MSTAIVIATTCMPIQVVGGRDQCSSGCKHFQRYSGGKCAMFGPLQLKPKTKRIYFRDAACFAAELLARDLSPAALTAKHLADLETGRRKGETGAF